MALPKEFIVQQNSRKTKTALVHSGRETAEFRAKSQKNPKDGKVLIGGKTKQ